MNNSLIPCNFSVIEENDTLVKVRLRVVRTGVNSNNCAFDLSSIKNAEKTCCNIPILAHIRKDDLGNLDFDDHNIITKLVTTPEGLKLEEYYIEQPIGLVPESNEVCYEEVDGETWLSVIGYIWKGYSNEALSIIENSDYKGISMEIKVLDGAKDNDGIYNINNFIFRGITVLGDHVRPAIEGAKLEKFSSNVDIDYSRHLLEFSNKLDEVFRKEDTKNMETTEIVIETQEETIDTVLNTEDNSIHNVEITTESDKTLEEVEEAVETEEVQVEEVETEETTKEPVEETKDEEVLVEETSIEVEVETTEETVEVVAETETEGMNFSLSFDNIYALIEKELASYTVTRKDWDGEEYETNRYWLRTILPLESVVIVEDREDNWNTLGIKYAIENDKAILDMDSMVEYISTWRVKKTDEVAPKNFSLEAEAVKELANKKIASLETELEDLRNFKAETEKAQLTIEVNEIISEFNFSEEEVADVKAQAIEKAITLDGLKKELFALEGMKAFSKRTKFSSEDVKSSKVKVQKSFENESTVYGSLTRFL